MLASLWPTVVCASLAVAPAIRSSSPRLGRLPIDPATHRSDDGTFELHIDPSARDGSGSADYVASSGGSERWRSTLPFTLHEVALADDGTAVGFSLFDAREGDSMLVGAIDPLGRVLCRESIRREWGRGCGESSHPLPLRVFVVPRSPRWVVHVREGEEVHDSWWVRDLATGVEVERIDPRTREDGSTHLRWIDQCLPLRGAPLVLVQWRSLSDDDRVDGMRVSLFDAHLRRVWSLDRPSEFVRADWDASCAAYREVDSLERGAIVRWDEPGRFDLWLPLDRDVATFEVEEAGSDWCVVERGRRPATTAKEAAGLAEESSDRPRVELPVLRALGDVDLEPCRDPLPEVRDIEAFTFDERGNVAVLRAERDGKEMRYAVVLVDGDGKALAHQRLPPRDAERGRYVEALEHLGDGRFLVAWRAYDYREHGRVFVVTPRTGDLRELEHEFTYRIDSLAAARDGRFYVLADNELDAFDRDVRHLWRRTESDRLCGGGEMRVLPDGRLVVIDSGARGFQWIDADGTIGRYRSASAKKSWWSALFDDEDSGSGFLLAGDGHVRAYDAGGDRVKSVRVRFADGRAPRAIEHPRRAPDGRLWVSDRHALHVVDEEGRVTRTLGEFERPDRLVAASQIVLGPRDVLYVESERSRRVFEIQVGGREPPRLLDASPPAAHDPWRVSHELVADAEGVARLEWDRDERRVTRSSLAGERVRAIPWTSEEYDRQLVALGIGERAWFYDGIELQLLDAQGRMLRSAQRRLDRRWLSRGRIVGTTPDGSVVLLDGHVIVYGPDAVARAQHPVAGNVDGAAFDGERVVALDEGEVVVHHLGRGSTIRARLEGVDAEESRHWRAFLPRARDELWLFDGFRTLKRFELPRG